MGRMRDLKATVHPKQKQKLTWEPAKLIKMERMMLGLLERVGRNRAIPAEVLEYKRRSPGEQEQNSLPVLKTDADLEPLAPVRSSKQREYEEPLSERKEGLPVKTQEYAEPTTAYAKKNGAALPGIFWDNEEKNPQRIMPLMQEYYGGLMEEMGTRERGEIPEGMRSFSADKEGMGEENKSLENIRRILAYILQSFQELRQNYAELKRTCSDLLKNQNGSNFQEKSYKKEERNFSLDAPTITASIGIFASAELPKHRALTAWDSPYINR